MFIGIIITALISVILWGIGAISLNAILGFVDLIIIGLVPIGAFALILLL